MAPPSIAEKGYSAEESTKDILVQEHLQGSGLRVSGLGLRVKEATVSCHIRDVKELAEF